METTIVDLMAFATRCVADEEDGAQLRAGISRAYYAGFHSLMPFVEKLPPSVEARPTDKSITHHEVACRVGEWKAHGLSAELGANRALKDQVVRALTRTRALRITADYRLKTKITLIEAKGQIEGARRLVRACDEIDRAINPPAPVPVPPVPAA